MFKNKKIIIIFGILILLVLLVSGTYAYYLWTSSDEDSTKIVTDVGVVTINYDAGASITNQTLMPVSDKTLGIIKTITVNSDDPVIGKEGFEIKFDLYLDMVTFPEELKHESFKYEIYKGSTLVKSANFGSESLLENSEACDDNKERTHIILLDDELVTNNISTYTLYIWLDGTMENPNSMQRKNFSFELHANGVNAILKEAIYPDITAVQEGTLAYKIVSEYDNSVKNTAINNNINYYLDEEHSLISDVGGNVRYYGAEPHNYIYFNCDDYNNQTSDTCEKWRIIGVFQDKVKIVNTSSVGIFSWDYDYNDGNGETTSNGSWSTSSLMTLLNSAYLNNEDTIYYQNLSTAEPSEANFNTDGIGIKDSTRNLIENVIWNTGGCSTNVLYSDEFFKCERGVEVYSSSYPTSWTSKIALMYPSDFGYATDFNKCNLTLNTYTYINNNNFNDCGRLNWLRKQKINIYNANGLWLMTHINSSVFSYGRSGLGIGSNGPNTFGANYYYGVVPTLFLNANLAINNIGDGSSGNPYQLVVNNE